MAWTKIETQTLTSSAGTISFSSLGDYKDLFVVLTGIQTSGANSLRIRVGNGSVDTGNNYQVVSSYRNGVNFSSTGEDNTSGYFYTTGDGTSTVYSNYIINFPNYKNTTRYKTFFGISGRFTDDFSLNLNMWKSTSAITVISFAFGATFPSANFASGTKATLYGIS